ncbi:Unknown protein, partial [Striga hermonthica]
VFGVREMESSQCIGQDDELAKKLEEVSLSDREHNFIDIARGDIKIGDEECNRSLFGKIIGDRHASWAGIKQSMSNIWRIQQSMEVKELGPNFFQFIFLKREDLLRVAKGTNWIFDNQYLILAEWQEGLSINHPVFSELKIWVQVFNIPLNWLCTEVGMKIGRVFKKVNNVVVVGAGSHGGRIMRLLVTVDLTEALPRCANIRLDNREVKGGFKYESLVNHCHYCGHIGHLERRCLIRQQDINNNLLKEGQFGDWMRAPEFNSWASFGNSSSRSTPQTDPPHVGTQSNPLPTSTSHVEDNNQIIVAKENLAANPSDRTNHVAGPIITTTPDDPDNSIALNPLKRIVCEEDCINRNIEVELESGNFNRAIAGCSGVQKHISKTWRRPANRERRLQRLDPPNTQNFIP